MKQFLRYANLIALVFGAIGFVLLRWLLSVGTDSRGLYPANHIAWILLGILSAVAVAAIWLLVRKAGSNRNYRANFPTSATAALGCCAAGIGLVAGGLQTLNDGNTLCMICGVIGILSGLPLFWAALCRYRGLRSKLPVHILPCFFFALQLFVLGQEFGSEPEMYRYLYRFWASVTAVPACYWLWSFDVKMGNRCRCLFWCLVAGYCNLVAMAHGTQWILHGGIALWMLTALPQLKYLPKPAKTTDAVETPSEQWDVAIAEEDAELTTESAQVSTAPEHRDENPLAVELPDPEAILQKLLQEYDAKEKP